MATLKILPDAVDRFVCSILTQFVKPIIGNSAQELSWSRTKFNAVIKLGLPTGGVKGMGGPIAGGVTVGQTANKQDLTDLFDKLLSIARFLQENVLPTAVDGAPPYTELFAKTWCNSLLDEIITNVLKPSIPEDKSGFESYSEDLQNFLRFEREVKEIGLIPPNREDISDFVSSVHLHFAEKKRAELLITVRDILQSEDQNTAEVTDATERGGLSALKGGKGSGGKGGKDAAGGGKGGKGTSDDSEAPLKLPTMHVSVQAQTIVEMVYQTLNDLESADEASKIELFYCARDIFDAFRAIVPVHHADSLENIPARTMLFYNDCEYICYHLLTLGWQYGSLLPAPLDGCATFLDMVVGFRGVGEGLFRGMMRKQRDELLARVKLAAGFKNLVDDARSETVERALKQTLYHLGGLAKVWKPIMPTDLYLGTIGTLVDTVVRAVLAEVAALQGVSTEGGEAHQLRYLLALVGKCEAHFVKISGVGKKKVVEKAPVYKYVKSWEIYQQAVGVLEKQPKDVCAVVSKGLEGLHGKEVEGRGSKMVNENPEFQAVILAGHGTHGKLYPLAEEDNVPKALLPIAGKPLLYYQLQWLEQAGITDVIILVRGKGGDGSARQKIQNYYEKVYKENHKISERLRDPILRAVTGDGTADALRAVKDLIKTDFIVLTCDFVTDLSPQTFFDTHRIQKPTVTSLFYNFQKLASGAERVPKDDREEYIGIDQSENRLVLLKSRADVSEDVPIRTTMMERFPKTRIHTNLRSGHVYIFRRWVIDFLCKTKTPNINSIRLDLLPLLVECQYRSAFYKREGIDKLRASDVDILKDARAKSSSGSGNNAEEDDGVKCIAVVCKEEFTARARSIWTYGEINRHLAKNAGDHRIAPSAEVSSRAQIGPDSMIGEGSKMGERCSVKKSVIGAHCTIGKNVQIARSVVMDYVVIEDNVKLEGCVVCNNAKVEEKSNLKDSEVAAGVVVVKDTTGKGECYDGPTAL
ncbi:Centromere/kinetochore protein zw10 [Rhizophlyctis rosea]|nr:Centromere/kinetochore protein zw10 [Rhizophlyctis rosea]